MTPAVEAAKRAGVEFRLHEYEGVEVAEADGYGEGRWMRVRPRRTSHLRSTDFGPIS